MYCFRNITYAFVICILLSVIFTACNEPMDTEISSCEIYGEESSFITDDTSEEVIKEISYGVSSLNDIITSSRGEHFIYSFHPRSYIRTDVDLDFQTTLTLFTMFQCG